MNLTNTVDALHNQIYSAKRELKSLREQAQTKQGQKLRDHESNIERLLKRIRTLEAMQATATEIMAAHPAKCPPAKYVPFHSSGTREFQKPATKSSLPNFHKGDHEWDFGYQSRCKTIDMAAFNYDVSLEERRAEEALNDPGVLVGLHSSHSLCRDTDFYGPKENAIIKSHLTSPNVVPVLADWQSLSGSWSSGGRGDASLRSTTSSRQSSPHRSPALRQSRGVASSLDTFSDAGSRRNSASPSPVTVPSPTVPHSSPLLKKKVPRA